MRLSTIAVASLAAIVVAGLPAAAAAAGSGIAGRVVAGPTCPVERIPPDCAPRPLIATVRISGRTLVRLVRTNSSGRFSVRLPPGRYRVVGEARAGSPLPRPPAPVTVTVRRGRTTTVNLTYDSGIR